MKVITLLVAALMLVGCTLSPYIKPIESADMPEGYYQNLGELTFYGKPPG
jgi:hypothetical protein